MIISHRNRFIFIKTRKTAGSSLEIGLSRACGPEDIITPLSANRGEEELRRAEGGQGPTNYHKRPLEHRGWKEWRRLLFRGRRTEYPQHARAAQIRSFIGPGIWHSYFRFTIERNPWDRALSRYWWQKHRWEEKGRDNFPSLSKYLAWLEENKPHWLSNWDHYTIDEEIAVNRVLRYENLNAELSELQQELGLDADIRLPKQRAKGGFRQGRQDYREILTDTDRAIIDRVCRREIDAFGYRFEDG